MKTGNISQKELTALFKNQKTAFLASGREDWSDRRRRLVRLRELISGNADCLAQAVSEAARYSVTHGLGVQPSQLHTCQLLMDAIHKHMEYVSGSTTVQTTAQEAFAQAQGVCQDYAHIMAALLRQSGIPARYVCGLTAGEGKTHAWVDAHLDGIWVGFDPTRNCMTDESYLALNVGRDWSDCPIERATFQGFAEQTQTVFAQMEEVVE